MRARVAAVAPAIGLAAVLAVPARSAAPPGRAAPVPPAGAVQASVTLRPARVQLGERAVLEGRVIVRPGTAMRWIPPASDSLFSWNDLRAWRSPGYAGHVGHPYTADTVHVRVLLQAFATGVLPVRGMGFQITDATGRLHAARLPALRLFVTPVIAANDTAARLRPLRGPLPAPWWERVPWRWVVAALAAVALAVGLWRIVRRRRPHAVPGPDVAPAMDPVQRALAELDALRGLRLPEQGRYGEHAFHLTRIARTFLEAASGVTRPGDSTPELIARLDGGDLSEDDRETLAQLLRSWDLLKFARVGSSVVEARRSEQLLEALVRRWDEARRPAAPRVA